MPVHVYTFVWDVNSLTRVTDENHDGDSTVLFMPSVYYDCMPIFSHRKTMH